jgi:hypothetical protein
VISVSWLKVWWAVYNHQLFDNQLTLPSIDIVAYNQTETFTQFGQFSPGSLGVSVDIVCVDIARATLLHEMVHQWQYENGYKLDHGQRFKDQAARILAATGIEI